MQADILSRSRPFCRAAGHSVTLADILARSLTRVRSRTFCHVQVGVPECPADVLSRRTFWHLTPVRTTSIPRIWKRNPEIGEVYTIYGALRALWCTECTMNFVSFCFWFSTWELVLLCVSRPGAFRCTVSNSHSSQPLWLFHFVAAQVHFTIISNALRFCHFRHGPSQELRDSFQIESCRVWCSKMQSRCWPSFRSWRVARSSMAKRQVEAVVSEKDRL